MPLKDFRRVPFFGHLSWARKKGEDNLCNAMMREKIILMHIPFAS